jgi:hypothetical protein
MYNFTQNCILIKSILFEIILSKGGINFFSKNFELSLILRNFLIQSTESLFNDRIISPFLNEENFFTFNKINENDIAEKSNFAKSIYGKSKESTLNKVLINFNDNNYLDNEFIIKINLLQLRHIFDLAFMVIINKISFYYLYSN